MEKKEYVRPRNVNLALRVTREERDMIERRMAQTGMKNIRAYIVKMAVDGRVIHVELDKLISAAGQSGIAADELTRFAEDAAKMGVAFDLPAERAGELAAVIRSSLGMTQDEFVTLADKINYFGNTTVQSADKIIEVVEATGLIGQQAGVSADQIAAMSAAMNGAMDASNMGTALSSIYSSLMQGSGATANAQKAWKSLGFTSEQVAKSMLADSEGTMTEIFAAMNNLPAEQLSSTIGAIFGDNKSTKMAIASFTANLDKLEANFAAIGDATLYAGSMQDEFNARAETTENKIKLAENAINRLKIGIGDLLLPAVAQGANLFTDAIEAIRQKIPALTEKLQGLQPTIDNLKRLFTVLSSAATSVGNTILSSFTGEEVAAVDAFGSGLDILISIVNSLTDGIAFVAEFVQNNWSIIGPIVMGITSALIAYKAAMIGVTVATKAALIIEALSKAWAFGSTVMAIFSSGAKVATIAQWALNAAMTANPIGVVIVAIGALIALIALLVMNWDTVKAKVIEVWGTLQSTLGNIGTWFQGVFAQAQGAFQNFMGNLSERFPLLASIISVPIEAIKGYIAGLQQFLGGIIDFVTGVPVCTHYQHQKADNTLFQRGSRNVPPFEAELFQEKGRKRWQLSTIARYTWGSTLVKPSGILLPRR